MSHQAIVLNNQRIPKPSQYGNKIITPYQKYQMDLDNNCRILSVKYPLESNIKIKELLEELDNNIQMVDSLLEQQHHVNLLHKSEGQNKNIANINQIKKLPNQQENKILKKTIASLYSKLKSNQNKVKVLQEENEKLQKQKEFYKNRCKLLVEQQFNQRFDQNLNIF